MSNNLIKHTESITQIKLPLPFPLRWVNGYVLRGDDGFTVIDPGLHTTETEQTWEEAMRTLGMGFADVERVVLTHYHPDHYGMAGWFQERTGAPVFLSETGIAQTQLLWGPEQPMTRLFIELFARHGLDAALREEMTKHMDGFVPLVSPQPRLTPLRAGDVLRMGGASYEAFETPGHAAGHLCFYDAAAQQILCGDHVLPQISPNVSFMPGIEANPLGEYLSSLAEIRKLPVSFAFPGHREPFAAFGERAAELIEHHRERLAAMLELLQRQGPLTAYGLCRAVFGDRLSVHQLRFALAETLAHLIYMEAEGTVAQTERDDIVLYSSLLL